MIVSKYPPIIFLLITKRKIETGKKIADTTLAKLQTQHHQYWDKLMFWLPGMMYWKEHNFTTVVFLPKMLNLNSNHEEIKKRSKWGGRTFYKITSLYSSKILLAKKKKRLKYCSTLKETKETWQLAAVCDLGFSFVVRDIIGTKWGLLIR